MASLAIQELIRDSEYFQNKQKSIKERPRTILSGLPGSSRSAVMAALSAAGFGLFIITKSLIEAERMKKELEAEYNIPAGYVVPTTYMAKRAIYEQTGKILLLRICWMLVMWVLVLLLMSI